MNRRFHTLTCDVIMEPVHSDRFYMDMRVYRIVPLMFDKPGVEPEPPVWRGIYLAMEMAPWEETDHASRG